MTGALRLDPSPRLHCFVKFRNSRFRLICFLTTSQALAAVNTNLTFTQFSYAAGYIDLVRQITCQSKKTWLPRVQGCLHHPEVIARPMRDSPGAVT